MKKTVRRGFTLPEILVTVTVVAVLAAVVVPAVGQFTSRGDGASTVSDFNSIKTGVTAYVTANRTYPTNLVDIAPYGSFNFASTATTATYTAAGYGYVVGSLFADSVMAGTTYRVITLSAPTSTKTCAEIDKEIDGGNGGTAGSFHYGVAGTTTPCEPAAYYLMPK